MGGRVKKGRAAIEQRPGGCYNFVCPNWIGRAEVAESADALRSGRSWVHPSGGSNPPFGTRGAPETAAPLLAALRNCPTAAAASNGFLNRMSARLRHAHASSGEFDGGLKPRDSSIVSQLVLYLPVVVLSRGMTPRAVVLLLDRLYRQARDPVGETLEAEPELQLLMRETNSVEDKDGDGQE